MRGQVKNVGPSFLTTIKMLSILVLTNIIFSTYPTKIIGRNQIKCSVILGYFGNMLLLGIC